MFIKLPKTFLQDSFRIAYEQYYGRPLKSSRDQKTIKAHHRLYHGILHAVSCMELVPKIDGFYQKHVSNYERTITSVANYFNFSREDLLTLVGVTALFHDAGREEDGVDLWDDVSGQILYTHLMKYDIPDVLAKLLSWTIIYKDQPLLFIKEIQALRILADPAINLDHLRQLVNTADTLEVIRDRGEFQCRYLSIHQKIPAAQRLMTEDILQEDLDQLIIQVAARINEESRAIYEFQQVKRLNGSSFHIKNDKRPNPADHDAAFRVLCARYHYDLPQEYKDDALHAKELEWTESVLKMQRTYRFHRADRETQSTVDISPIAVSKRNLEKLKLELRSGLGLSTDEMSLRGSDPLLPIEQQVYHHLLTVFPWTLKHVTRNYNGIVWDGNVLKSSRQRHNREARYQQSTCITDAEGRLDYLFFTVASPDGAVAGFLKQTTGYEISIPLRSFLNPSIGRPEGPLAGLSIGSAWFNFTDMIRASLPLTSKITQFEGTTRQMSYHRTNLSSNKIEGDDFKKYHYHRQDGSILERRVAFHEESCVGAEILQVLALNLILELRMIGGEYRQNCLADPSLNWLPSFVDNIYYTQTNFEALVPSMLGLNHPSIHIKPMNQEEISTDDNSKRMMRAILASEPVSEIQSLLDEGVSVDMRLHNTTPLGLCFAINQIYRRTKFVSMTSNLSTAMRFLVHQGADIDRSVDQGTFIYHATECRLYAVLECMLKRGTKEPRALGIRHDFSERDLSFGIIAAVVQQDRTVLQIFKRYGVNFNIFSSVIFRAMILLPELGALDMLDFMKTEGVNLE